MTTSRTLRPTSTTTGRAGAVLAALALAVTLSGCTPAASTTDTGSAASAPTATLTPSASPSPTSGSEASIDRALLLDHVAQERSCDGGSLTLDDAPEGEVLRVTGHCDEIVVPMRGTVLVADDVAELRVESHDVLVSTTALGAAELQGDDIVVGWSEGDAPEVTDEGSGNVVLAEQG
ncbi:hypothetical protein [Mycetocola reblochoni]|uniref:DUF3060 domain-containing protein n=2 Tax=Mycetocola reblochoni TaxID=331618 RepID=A0A1R4JVS5_9MICO|nr:hypothetical protein [Mycetocola reblochoni]RLP68258.1 hypothetical protein D9V30_11165 [Mycetocola reblochoni]SJN36069.1 hypothetical protein FM119_09735 [Mycetocola reblochoni REB411]